MNCAKVLLSVLVFSFSPFPAFRFPSFFCYSVTPHAALNQPSVHPIPIQSMIYQFIIIVAIIYRRLVCLDTFLPAIHFTPLATHRIALHRIIIHFISCRHPDPSSPCFAIKVVRHHIPVNICAWNFQCFVCHM